MLHQFSISYLGNMQKIFKIIKKYKQTRARLGLLKTIHGVVKTPAYVFVGTYGRFLHLSPKDLKVAKVQVAIANTFHLWDRSKKEKDFLAKCFGKMPTMTDSGGFQVLSLAFDDKNKIGKFMTGDTKPDVSYIRTRIKITSQGVKFLWNGRWKFLGPELSMKIQSRIGADVIFAFDHITSPLDNYEYNKKAIAVTDKWAKICLKTRNPKQLLFGIVQGGLFKDLRIKSAKSIGAMPFDGFGIGG